MVELVEARRDVRLEHPQVVPGGRPEVVDLGDGVLGAALRAEAVGARLEVRLEDRFEHQLECGLHDAVGGGRDAQPAHLPVRLRDHRLPHRCRAELVGLEGCSQPLQPPSGPVDEEDDRRARVEDPEGIRHPDGDGGRTAVLQEPAEDGGQAATAMRLGHRRVGLEGGPVEGPEPHLDQLGAEEPLRLADELHMAPGVRPDVLAGREQPPGVGRRVDPHHPPAVRRQERAPEPGRHRGLRPGQACSPPPSSWASCASS